MPIAENIGVDKSLKRLSLLRRIDPWMGIQTAYALAVIAQRVRHEGRTMMVKDIAAELETTTASATRNVRSLVNYKLIELTDHPCVKVAKCIKLTKYGNEVLDELFEVYREEGRAQSPDPKANLQE